LWRSFVLRIKPAPNIIPQPATDEAARLRAAMRMQGEEDVVKFRHLLLRELLAERERLQRVLDSKVRVKPVLQSCGCF
jgi:hypothetical protein